MTTTKDEYQLPTGVYNNVPEIMRAHNLSEGGIYRQLRGERKQWIFKIEIEEEES
ncbi:hypothetical protein [Peptostreptococcus anaerobius]|uniref:hypothetical protein n=1 Tax=Peptostreptococcus anaerobius TaxID=1261 RepID=UPI00242A6E5C|nr:hypothetical protein [Peptostreptococcus anaerobius]